MRSVIFIYTFFKYNYLGIIYFHFSFQFIWNGFYFYISSFHLNQFNF